MCSRWFVASHTLTPLNRSVLRYWASSARLHVDWRSTLAEFNDVTLRRNLTLQILPADVATALTSGLLGVAGFKASPTFDPPHPWGSGRRALLNLVGQLAMSLYPRWKGKEQMWQHEVQLAQHLVPSQAVCCLSCRQRDSVVPAWRCPRLCSSHPVCFPARSGSTCDHEKRTTLLKINILFQTAAAKQKKSACVCMSACPSITALPCVFGSSGTSPGPGSWGWKVLFPP